MDITIDVNELPSRGLLYNVDKFVIKSIKNKDFINLSTLGDDFDLIRKRLIKILNDYACEGIKFDDILFIDEYYIYNQLNIATNINNEINVKMLECPDGHINKNIKFDNKNDLKVLQIPKNNNDTEDTEDSEDSEDSEDNNPLVSEFTSSEDFKVKLKYPSISCIDKARKRIENTIPPELMDNITLDESVLLYVSTITNIEPSEAYNMLTDNEIMPTSRSFNIQDIKKIKTFVDNVRYGVYLEGGECSDDNCRRSLFLKSEYLLTQFIV